MRNLSIGQKLIAICDLDASSGITWCDHVDAKAMRIACGPKLDTSVLDDKQIERVEAIYDTFFD